MAVGIAAAGTDLAVRSGVTGPAGAATVVVFAAAQVMAALGGADRVLSTAGPTDAECARTGFSRC